MAQQALVPEIEFPRNGDGDYQMRRDPENALSLLLILTFSYQKPQLGRHIRQSLEH
jgi:hypothetical protein